MPQSWAIGKTAREEEEQRQREGQKPCKFMELRIMRTGFWDSRPSLVILSLVASRHHSRLDTENVATSKGGVPAIFSLLFEVIRHFSL